MEKREGDRREWKGERVGKIKREEEEFEKEEGNVESQ